MKVIVLFLAFLYPSPTGTATPMAKSPSEVIRWPSRDNSVNIINDLLPPKLPDVMAPAILYFSPKGKANAPCSKRQPCDIDSGREWLKKRKFSQTLVFFGFKPEQIASLVNM